MSGGRGEGVLAPCEKAQALMANATLLGGDGPLDCQGREIQYQHHVSLARPILGMVACYIFVQLLLSSGAIIITAQVQIVCGEH